MRASLSLLTGLSWKSPYEGVCSRYHQAEERASTDFALHVIQLVKRLLVISGMPCDAHIRITRRQAIYKIGCNRA